MGNIDDVRCAAALDQLTARIRHVVESWDQVNDLAQTLCETNLGNVREVAEAMDGRVLAFVFDAALCKLTEIRLRLNEEEGDAQGS